MRNLAFCYCQRIVDSNTQNLDDTSAIGYMEYSAYDDDFKRIELKEFSRKWIDENGKKYLSKSDSPMTTMKCLDFYNSKVLENYIMKQDNRIDAKLLKWIYEFEQPK